jgi:hypothetical protein
MSDLVTNAQHLVEIFLAIHALALLIVNLTPTQKDNQAVAKYYRIVEILAGIVTRLAKQ